MLQSKSHIISGQRQPVYAPIDSPSESIKNITSVFRDTHFIGIVSLLTSLCLSKGPPRSNQIAPGKCTFQIYS